MTDINYQVTDIRYCQPLLGAPSWIPAILFHSYGPVLIFAANSPSNVS